MNNTVDNKVRHVTSPDVNIFAELGFADAEAKSLKHDAEFQMLLIRKPTNLPLMRWS